MLGEWTKEDRRKVIVNIIHFVVRGHRLFRRGADGFLRRYMTKIKVPYILAACRDNACGGYFSSQLTGQNILKADYYWPPLFKDGHDYVKRCNACQRYAKNDLHMKMPLHVSLPLVSLEK